MRGAETSAAWLLLALLVTAAADGADKAADTKSDVFVGKCRSHCAAQLTSEASRESCLDQEECLRCWASCKAFQSDHYIRDYCKRNKACTVGCRQACSFYLNPSDTSSQPTRSAPVSSPRPVVVNLDWRSAGAGHAPIYSMVDGKEAVWDEDDVRMRKSSASSTRDGQARWTLRLTEMLFGSPLVSATVAWESQGQGLQYLATWELMSGGLRGHVVSADTSATLPLWPDEDYVVQVFTGDSASHTLYLSTRSPSPAPEQSAPPAAVPARLLALLLLLVAAAGCLAGLAVWRERRRRRRRSTALVDVAVDAADVDGDDRGTLLARSVRKLPPHVLADPGKASVFVVPCHKR